MRSGPRWVIHFVAAIAIALSATASHATSASETPTTQPAFVKPASDTSPEKSSAAPLAAAPSTQPSTASLPPVVVWRDSDYQLLDLELWFDPTDSLPSESSFVDVKNISPGYLARCEPGMHLLAVSKDGGYALLSNVYTTYSPWRVVFHLWPECTATVMALVWLWGSWWLVFRKLIPWLRMRRAGETACRQCGYSLRGSPSGVCPECGASQAAVARSHQTSRTRITIVAIFVLACPPFFGTLLWRYPMSSPRPGWDIAKRWFSGGRVEYDDDVTTEPFEWDDAHLALRRVPYCNYAEFVVMTPRTGIVKHRFGSIRTKQPWVADNDAPSFMATRDADTAVICDVINDQIAIYRLPDATLVSKYTANFNNDVVRGFTVFYRRLDRTGHRVVLADLYREQFSQINLDDGIERSLETVQANGLPSAAGDANALESLGEKGWRSGDVTPKRALVVSGVRDNASSGSDPPTQLLLFKICDDGKQSLLYGDFHAKGGAIVKPESESALVLVPGLDQITASTKKTGARIIARGRYPSTAIRGNLAFVGFKDTGGENGSSRPNHLRIRVCDLARWRWLPQELTIDMSATDGIKTMQDGRPYPSFITSLQVSEDQRTLLMQCVSSSGNDYLAMFDLEAAGIVAPPPATQVR